MDKLHPGARWLFRLRAYYPLLFVGLFISIYSFQILRFFAGGSAGIGFVLAIIFYIFFVIIVAEIYARMSYNRYLYEITHDGVKVERGIIWKKYTSIPYERVQNVDIKRGIIARMFGFSTVEIETAGQSGGWGGYGRYGRRNRRYQSEGHLPAIDVNGAEKIREFVMKRVKQTHGSGL
ncbi:PH domain-containing protein [archaeon]|jgi:uncharacterized membrane protein YdbT with pleckstrin-like domain|nr:PH domain-containing protein [archaeon]MBT4241561.1 PH domain-containing protein [archaeon]MBT4417567.1 PH domain-containing protein [archaeon]